jgi:hypothetical protein
MYSLGTIIRAHQIRLSGRHPRPISTEIALPRLQSEIKVAPFFANNLHFMVKLIDKAIVLCNQFKIHKKRFYSSNKEILSF